MRLAPFIVFDVDDVDAAAPAEAQPSGQDQPPADATVVQPEGQGHESNGLYDEAISSVPEEHRQYVEPHFKEWDRKVTEKLSEAADFRKSWEAYEDTGIREFDPEQVEALVTIADALSDKSKARAFLEGALAGLDDDVEPEVVEPVEDVDDRDRRLAVLEAERDERLKADRAVAELESLQSQFADVHERHGKDFTEKEEKHLASLADRLHKAGSETPLKDAYDLISEISGDAEAALVATKTKEPPPAVPAGRAATRPVPVETFEEAGRLLRERQSATA